jgi:hypothetical protein
VELFKEMLIHDPMKRISAKEALAKFRALSMPLDEDIRLLPVPPRLICDNDAAEVERFVGDKSLALSRAYRHAFAPYVMLPKMAIFSVLLLIAIWYYQVKID